MTQYTDNAIRRHADGSIDTGFYLARGRVARSRQAHRLLGAASRQAGRVHATLIRYLNAAGAIRGLHRRARPNLG